ncbi:MAG: restriction endonuclease, partial [Candidatus Binataceae bacterium]
MLFLPLGSMSYRRYRYHRSWRRRTLSAARRRTKQSGTGTAIILVLIVGALLFSYNQADAAATVLVASAVAVCLVAIIGIAIWRWLKLQRAYRAIEFAQIDLMSGPQFEIYMAGVFRNLQFGVKHVGKTGDQGCDLILVRKGKRIACQLKRYAGAVGN